MRFTEFLRARGEGKERNVPWHLHDKIKCNDFCKTVGIPTVEILRIFESPGDIDLDGLPDQFALKPTYQSSGIGVMVLTRTETGFYDAMKRREFTFQEIVEKQQKIFDNSAKVVKPTIIEEKIEDIAGSPIPEDYKAYCFQGHIGFIVNYDRNGDKVRVAAFDSEFEPITDDRLMINERYLVRKEPVRPEIWKDLIHLARRASTAVPSPFVSIDMFATTSGPRLGEVTLVPGAVYFGKYIAPSVAEDYAVGRLWQRALNQLGR